ncbi:MAG: hypothetical protein A3D35_00305 [Candidatus Staskawiczbacteria bacterium RIFCSPHIGHO2_02_FULL_34_9]|uniref:Coenzyme F420:L-glutamate ligase-like domain-containing protein n=1 Tax=Candidatus Staskawiczbacteria bacterium RIFCSPHIGHO2_02_FULL_34_9 TaxID=1802206 RepID=A0A1G2I4J1_9BACT|nr:MAG: hypothetical protein A3D35_00305 [Candidatus Staskawiczbacteria bacterium RIFCSPHIGHO2_02_FULL_34_9]
MIVKAIKTRRLNPPKDDLISAIKQSIKKVEENSIIAITSKVVSIWQGQCVSMKDCHKDDLVTQEADFYLPRKVVPGAWCMHTLKNNVFIPSAGIDESNANGYYILWPEKLDETAKKLWLWLKKEYKVKNVGIIITDSHTIPLRRGVLGISLAHYGFNPLKDYRDKKDLFGREFKMTQTNIADGLAAASVVLMGEGAESTPICIIKDIPWVKFTSKPMKYKKPFSSFIIKTKEDLYYPLFKSMPWEKGKKKKSLLRLFFF